MKPGWFSGAKIYQILIDRFSGADITQNTPDFLGGTLKGIAKKLEYLRDLGIDTIWISPFYKTNEYHGYHILDFMRVESRFGTKSDLKHLIEKAHKCSLRIIADFVPNHCSFKHPYFIEARNNMGSAYFNWFYFKTWPDDYLCFLDVKELPKLNLDNPDTRSYIIDAARYWLSLGIDGYRIDHIIGPSHKFWETFYSEIKTEYPDCILFGEAWGAGVVSAFFETINIRNKIFYKIFGISQESLQKQYYGVMDGVLDFRLNEIMIEAIKRGRGFTCDKKFLAKVDKHFSKYRGDYYLITFLDNHDMNRFLRHCNGDIDLLLEALEFIIKTGHPVVIYYGTETGMSNYNEVRVDVPYSDLNVRAPFDWQSLNSNLINKVKELFDKYKKS